MGELRIKEGLEVDEQIKIFREFIEQNSHPELLEAVRKGQESLTLDFAGLVKFNPEISEEILEAPEELLKAAEIAIKEFDLPKKISKFTVRFTNLPESQKIKISEIRSKHLNKLIWSEGIVRQKSDVRPHVTAAKFECPSCGNILNVLQLDQKYKEPTRCGCGRKGKFKEISKELVDGQGLVLEESPDDLDGSQPKRINVFLKDDLVSPISERRSSPGSRVKLCGWLTEVPITLRSGGQSTKYDLIIEANNVEPVEDNLSELKVTPKEIAEIEKIAQNPNCLSILANSIAPSIYGHEKVKEALVLQLAGGCRKIRPDGVITRGDMHVLLIGDPGSGKSQLLKRITKVAPKARFTSGKGATGAGLTASVVKDEFLGGWSLEAGTLVLANQGFAVIDEMDKMGKEDRSALHEALEQQSYHPDTEITFADGSVSRIGPLVDDLMNSNSELVIEGKDCQILPINHLSVLTTDFNKIYPTKINRVSRHLAPSEFVEITYSNGRTITVTPEHPVYIYSKGFQEVPAEDVKPGSLAPAPRTLPFVPVQTNFTSEHMPFEVPEQMNEQLASFLGYFATEGHSYSSKNYAEIGISNTNPDINFQVFNLMKGIAPININRNIRSVLSHKKATLPLTTTRWSSKPLHKFFSTNFNTLMQKAPHKRLSNTIRTMGRKHKISFLKTAFQGDGFIDSERCGFSTASFDLAKDYQDFLLSLNIYSYIVKEIRKQKKYFKIVISGAQSLQLFFSMIVSKKDHRYERLHWLAKRSLQKNNDRDVMPTDLCYSIKEILKQLRSDDGYFVQAIKKEQNVHRKTLEKYVGNIEDTLQECSNLLAKENVKELRSKINIQYQDLAKYCRKSLSQVRYSLRKNELREEILSLSREKINELQKKAAQVKKITKSDLRFVRVVSVKKIPNKDIKWAYDVTVEPNHTFISEGVVLHNTISIAKANIQATLRCETTVIAAANPKFGRFDPYDLIANQIDMPPTLINRFDLIFPVKDMPNREKDEQTATFILNLHKDPESAVSEIPSELLRKYFAYIRQRMHPKMSDEAIEELKNYYISMRNNASADENGIKSIPITARQLEGLVRLSEAAAKIRLAKTVTKEDARIAIELTDYCLNQIAKDQETGKIDIDRLGGRITATQRSSISTLKEIINALEEQLNEKIIPIEQIIEAAQGKNLTKEKVEEILEKLRRSGDVFEPKRGFIQRL